MNHTLALSQDGLTLWSFGDGDYGKLGLGNNSAKPTPQKVEALCAVGIKQIGCGSQFSAILLWDGRLFMCGQGIYPYFLFYLVFVANQSLSWLSADQRLHCSFLVISFWGLTALVLIEK